MKKFFALLLTVMVAYGYSNDASAQVTDSIMPVQSGNFEEWVDYPGDTTMIIFPIPLYGAYSLPEGWHVPLFTVNDTVDYSGMTLPLNFSVPLAKISRDTVHAPQGRSALVAETFLLEDVLTPIANALAMQLLDSSLAYEPIPSIVTNTEVDMMKILPLLQDASMNPDDMSWLMDMIDTVDLNEYFRGGSPLNGFEPKMLRGMYKYWDGNGDGDIDDRATLVMLGTYYDSFLGRRMLVGAGSKNLYKLWDTVNYEPFKMDYYTLNEYYPEEYAFVQADTVVIIAISSTSGKSRARGSKLYLDSLEMMQYDGSCGRVYDVNVTGYSTIHAVIEWHNTVVPDRWTIEFGPEGFARSHGARLSVTDSVVTLTGLEPNTTYDFYVRSECGDTANSVWGYVRFTTDSIIPHKIDQIVAERVTLTPNPAHGRCEVDFGGLGVSRMVVYTATGQMVESRSVNGASATVMLPNKGVFVIELQTSEGKVYKRVVNY